MTSAKRTAASFALSFIIYLTPLVGPHAAFLLGEVVWRDLRNVFQRQGDRTFAWIATEVGIAILAQLSVFIIVYWLLRRPGLAPQPLCRDLDRSGCDCVELFIHDCDPDALPC